MDIIDILRNIQNFHLDEKYVFYGSSHRPFVFTGSNIISFVPVNGNRIYYIKHYYSDSIAMFIDDKNNKPYKKPYTIKKFN